MGDNSNVTVGLKNNFNVRNAAKLYLIMLGTLIFIVGSILVFYLFTNKVYIVSLNGHEILPVAESALYILTGLAIPLVGVIVVTEVEKQNLPRFAKFLLLLTSVALTSYFGLPLHKIYRAYLSFKPVIEGRAQDVLVETSTFCMKKRISLEEAQETVQDIWVQKSKILTEYQIQKLAITQNEAAKILAEQGADAFNKMVDADFKLAAESPTAALIATSETPKNFHWYEQITEFGNVIKETACAHPVLTAVSVAGLGFCAWYAAPLYMPVVGAAHAKISNLAQFFPSWGGGATTATKTAELATQVAALTVAAVKAQEDINALKDRADYQDAVNDEGLEQLANLAVDQDNIRGEIAYLRWETACIRWVIRMIHGF